MDTPEFKVHSFIVKLWLEEAGDQAGAVIWHGQITHVPSGERRSLRELDSILSFVKSYLYENDAERMQGSPVSRWLRSWFRRKS